MIVCEYRVLKGGGGAWLVGFVHLIAGILHNRRSQSKRATTKKQFNSKMVFFLHSFTKILSKQKPVQSPIAQKCKTELTFSQSKTPLSSFQRILLNKHERTELFSLQLTLSSLK